MRKLCIKKTLNINAKNVLPGVARSFRNNSFEVYARRATCERFRNPIMFIMLSQRENYYAKNPDM